MPQLFTAVVDLDIILERGKSRVLTAEVVDSTFESPHQILIAVRIGLNNGTIR